MLFGLVMELLGFEGMQLQVGLLEDGVLRATLTGEQTLRATLQATAEIDELCACALVRSVMVDARGLTRRLTRGECMMLALMLGPAPQSQHRPAVAHVDLPEFGSAATELEHALLGSGRLWTGFSSEASALAWLRLHAMLAASEEKMREVGQD